MKTLEEICNIRDEKRKELDLRVNTKADTREKHILVCQGTGCTSSKSPEILELVKDNKLAYSDGVRLNKKEIAELGEELPIKYVNLDNVDYLAKLKQDYKARVGNVVLGMCKDLIRKDFKRKRRAYNFGNFLKVFAKENRGRRESIIKETCKILASVDKTAQVDFMMSVKEIEKQQEIERNGSNVR